MNKYIIYKMVINTMEEKKTGRGNREAQRADLNNLYEPIRKRLTLQKNRK